MSYNTPKAPEPHYTISVQIKKATPATSVSERQVEDMVSVAVTGKTLPQAIAAAIAQLETAKEFNVE